MRLSVVLNTVPRNSRRAQVDGEKHYFAAALASDLAMRPESDIASGGHVVDTLTVSLWCLLTSRGYTETVLKAVNLGGDTDMTGVAQLGKHNLPAVAGGRLDGLAGVEGGGQGGLLGDRSLVRGALGGSVDWAATQAA